MYMPWWGNKFFTWQHNKVDAYLIYMKLLALVNLHFPCPFLISYCQRIMLVVPLSPRPPSGRGLRFEPLFCNKEKGVMEHLHVSSHSFFPLASCPIHNKNEGRLVWMLNLFSSEVDLFQHEGVSSVNMCNRSSFY